MVLPGFYNSKEAEEGFFRLRYRFHSFRKGRCTGRWKRPGSRRVPLRLLLVRLLPNNLIQPGSYRPRLCGLSDCIPSAIEKGPCFDFIGFERHSALLFIIGIALTCAPASRHGVCAFIPSTLITVCIKKRVSGRRACYSPVGRRGPRPYCSGVMI